MSPTNLILESAIICITKLTNQTIKNTATAYRILFTSLDFASVITLSSDEITAFPKSIVPNKISNIGIPIWIIGKNPFLITLTIGNNPPQASIAPI